MKVRQAAAVVPVAAYFAYFWCAALGVGRSPSADWPWLSSLVRFGGPPGEVARTLLFCSGANNTYSYFAPGVPDESAVELWYTAPDGREWRENVADSFGHEGRHRAYTALCLSASLGDEDLHREALASWAAWGLRRNPEADACAVSLKSRRQPTMAEFRAGARPEWVQGPQVTFRRDQVADLAE
jgi:hypothetical protein